MKAKRFVLDREDRGFGGGGVKEVIYGKQEEDALDCSFSKPTALTMTPSQSHSVNFHANLDKITELLMQFKKLGTLHCPDMN